MYRENGDCHLFLTAVWMRVQSRRQGFHLENISCIIQLSILEYVL